MIYSIFRLDATTCTYTREALVCTFFTSLCADRATNEVFLTHVHSRIIYKYEYIHTYVSSISVHAVWCWSERDAGIIRHRRSPRAEPGSLGRGPAGRPSLLAGGSPPWSLTSCQMCLIDRSLVLWCECERTVPFASYGAITLPHGHGHGHGGSYLLPRSVGWWVGGSR